MSVDVCADAVDGPLGVGEEPDERLEHVHHVVPDLQLDLDAGGPRPPFDRDRVVQEDLGLTHLEQQGWAVAEVGQGR